MIEFERRCLDCRVRGCRRRHNELRCLGEKGPLRNVGRLVGEIEGPDCSCGESGQFTNHFVDLLGEFFCGYEDEGIGCFGGVILRQSDPQAIRNHKIRTCFCFRIDCRTGSKYAAVFPEPVYARAGGQYSRSIQHEHNSPTTSLPCSAKGMA
jgi:hypothetical protein